MSTTTFTPGPWRRIGHRAIAVGNSPDMKIICEVWSGGVGIEEANGNEALIEAAPEMHSTLTAIQGALSAGNAFLPDQVRQRLMDVLTDAAGGNRP